MVVPAVFALVARDLDISLLVGWAFALAASTFCPLFLLGIWWRGLTARGAAWGMAAGACVASGGIALTLARDTTATTVGDALLAQPAAVSVPVAFLVMVGVSRLDRARRPRQVEAHMRALHAPEGLGLVPPR
jgi:Na+(H+)/acetate symporter ActP